RLPVLHRCKLDGSEVPKDVEVDDLTGGSDMCAAGGYVWLCGGRHLYRVKADGSGEPEVVEGETGGVHALREANGFVWAGANNGLFRCTLTGDSLASKVPGPDTNLV